jgi:hypothetical protein
MSASEADKLSFLGAGCAAVHQPNRASKCPAPAMEPPQNFFQKAWNNFTGQKLSRLG